jgi:hypothetical protein
MVAGKLISKRLRQCGLQKRATVRKYDAQPGSKFVFDNRRPTGLRIETAGGTKIEMVVMPNAKFDFTFGDDLIHVELFDVDYPDRPAVVRADET